MSGHLIIFVRLISGHVLNVVEPSGGKKKMSAGTTWCREKMWRRRQRSQGSDYIPWRAWCLGRACRPMWPTPPAPLLTCVPNLAHLELSARRYGRCCRRATALPCRPGLQARGSAFICISTPRRGQLMFVLTCLPVLWMQHIGATVANTQFLIDICMQFGSFHMSNAVLVINSLKKKRRLFVVILLIAWSYVKVTTYWGKAVRCFQYPSNKCIPVSFLFNINWVCHA